MNADEILKALFPHEETIKRLQAEIETLKAQVETLTKELADARAQPVSKQKGKVKTDGDDTREES